MQVSSTLLVFNQDPDKPARESPRLKRFGRTGDPADLDEAIAMGREVVRAIPADHPDRAKYLSNLGLTLYFRFDRTRDQKDLDAAAFAWTEALAAVSAAPSVRIGAAWVMARLFARVDAGIAADAAEAAVRLLPEVTLRQVGRGDQQHALSRFAGLAGDAAALALADPRGTRQERATRALQLLEAGRAVLLGQALDARSDLTERRAGRGPVVGRAECFSRGGVVHGLPGGVPLTCHQPVGVEGGDACLDGDLTYGQPAGAVQVGQCPDERALGAPERKHPA
ncbi:hypothetical protein ACFVXE_35635 [Streptomyces sp. NPDC058231]|uniref:hypothetical protein n=1 Tax=Streptomyces sp. NPDC058231 TaxID=3346392 RepID=UPI0036EE8A4E